MMYNGYILLSAKFHLSCNYFRKLVFFFINRIHYRATNQLTLVLHGELSTDANSEIGKGNRISCIINDYIKLKDSDVKVLYK